MPVNPSIQVISSSDRTSGTSSDFTYDLTITGNPSKFVVIDCSVPKTFYMVESGRNTFTVTETNTTTRTYTITLDVGNYSYSTLRADLQTLLTAGSLASGWSLTYTVTYSAKTGKYTYSYTGTTTGDSTFAFSGFLARRLGFVNSTTYTFSTGTLTSANTIDLIAQSNIYLCSNLGSNRNSVILNLPSANVPDYGLVEVVNYNTELYAQEVKGSLSNSYHFFLTKTDFTPLVLNGGEINFTIGFYDEDDTNEIIKKNIAVQNEEKIIKSKYKQ